MYNILILCNYLFTYKITSKLKINFIENHVGYVKKIIINPISIDSDAIVSFGLDKPEWIVLTCSRRYRLYKLVPNNLGNNKGYEDDGPIIQIEHIYRTYA